MKISWDQLESEVWRLFDLLPTKFTDPIRGRWKKLPRGKPTILTDPTSVDQAITGIGYTIDLAGTDGFNLWFRLDRINNSGEDIRLVILHELAHCYFLASRIHYWYQYAADEVYRDKCEVETIALSKKWFKKLFGTSAPAPNDRDRRK